MKKTRYLMTLLAVGIILTAGIGKTMAYFTTYTDAKGGFQILIGDDTEIEEEFDKWVKMLSISNKAGSQPVYVRARAYYAPDDLVLAYAAGTADNTVAGDWMGAGTASGKIAEPGGDADWYYFSEPLDGGETAAPLNITISNIPTDVIEGDTFNVIIVYESTPVLYDDEGNPYADWTTILEVINESETSGGTTTTPGVSENDPVNAGQTEGKTEITEGGSEQ